MALSAVAKTGLLWNSWVRSSGFVSGPIQIFNTEQWWKDLTWICFTDFHRHQLSSHSASITRSPARRGSPTKRAHMGWLVFWVGWRDTVGTIYMAKVNGPLKANDQACLVPSVSPCSMAVHVELWDGCTILPTTPRVPCFPCDIGAWRQGGDQAKTFNHFSPSIKLFLDPFLSKNNTKTDVRVYIYHFSFW